MIHTNQKNIDNIDARKKAEDYFLIAFIFSVLLSLIISVLAHFSRIVLVPILLTYAFGFIFAHKPTKQMLHTAVTLLLMAFILAFALFVQINRSAQVTVPAQSIAPTENTSDKAIITPTLSIDKIKIQVTDAHAYPRRVIYQEKASILKNDVAKEAYRINLNRLLRKALAVAFVCLSGYGLYLCQKRHKVFVE